MTGNIGDWALIYAARGLPVFPCRPGSKEPATRHGFLDATSDPDRIARWWRRYPSANLAIATGQPGPDVLDVDQHGPAGNGFAAQNQLTRAGLTRTAGIVVATPSGGLHLYFAGSDQRCGKLPRHHLDFRARGGYVLAPPSQVGGKPYHVIRYKAVSGGLDWNAVTRLLEPERREAALPADPRRGDPGNLAAWVAQQPEGNRNDALFWAACRAAEASDDEVLAQLAEAGRSAGLTSREVTATIRSAQRTAGHQPPEQRGGRECAS